MSGQDKAREMKERMASFAVRIVKAAEALARGRAADVMARQLIRCGTSVAANYRAALRARTRREFVAKLGIVEEELDETSFWIDMIIRCELLRARLLEPLAREADELLRIIVSSIRTARKRSSRKPGAGCSEPAPAPNPKSAIRNPKSPR